MNNIFDNTILPFVFKVSPTTLRFKELLVANRVLAEGMNVENSIHGFKLKLGKSYLLFFVIWFVFLVPVSALLHGYLAKIDSHILLVLTALLTGSYFITFSVFREYLIEKMALKVIKKAWARHLPLFPFEENFEKVAQFYGQAVEEEVASGDLQRYMFDKLAAS